MAAADLAKVLAAFDPGVSNPLLQPATVATMWTAPMPVQYPKVLRGWDLSQIPDANGVMQPVYAHAGWLFSTTSLMFHRADGLDVVLFFNKGVREVDELPAQGEEINRLINRVRHWPGRDLFPSLGIPSSQ